MESSHADHGDPADDGHTGASTLPHTLLLLADSALPLGSFAFSSGLESYLTHHPSRPRPPVLPFVTASLAAHASTTLPFVLATYRQPADLVRLDDALDATIPCPVARRASVAQGRALLAVWERAIRPASGGGSSGGSIGGTDGPPPSGWERVGAVKALAALSGALKATSHGGDNNGNTDDNDDDDDDPGDFSASLPSASGHLAPLWAVVCRLQGLGSRDTAYTYLYGHARAVLSAAVRAAALGPFQAQAILAGTQLQAAIQGELARWWAATGTGAHEAVDVATQSVPSIDLWVGRHELLYSRIFNS